jgi:hypothetical protein
MQDITRLIQKIATHPSTEELILFIASEDEMTRACITLQKRLSSSRQDELDDIASLCNTHQISIDVLSQEIQRILAIFAPDHVSDEYATLGLDPTADLGQIKQAFRRLSIKYHPDSASSSSDSDKFIEVCQAYKTIINRQGAGSFARPAKTANWNYEKKHKVSIRKKRKKKKNILFFTILAVLLFAISIITPFFYQKRVMRKNLHYADPVLETRPTATDDPPPSPTIPQKASDQEIPGLDIEPEATFSAIPDNDTLPAITYEIYPEEEAITASVSNPLQPTTDTLPVSSTVETEVPVISVSESASEVTAASIKQNDPVPPPVIKKTQPELPGKAAATQQYTQQIALQKSHPEKNNQQRLTTHTQPVMHQTALEPVKENPKPVLPSLSSLNNFLNAYTGAYKDKNLQKFSHFFTIDATENGKPFSEQREKYTQLFQNIDNIDFNIGLLSSSLQGEYILIKGRFQAVFTYPKAKPIHSKGAISLLLRNNKQRYLIKELNYTFNKTN